VSRFDQPINSAAGPMPAVDAVRAVVDQWQRVDQQITRIPDQGFARPTRLGGWRVAELVAHMTANMAMVVDLCQRPAPATANGQAIDWYTNSADFADAIADQGRQAARDRPAHLRAAHAHTLDTAVALLSTSDPARVVAAGPDGLTLEQLCVTRCVEAVVHGLDLSHSLDQPADIGHAALDICIRFFTALLARSSRPPLAHILIEDHSSTSTWTAAWGPATEGRLRTQRCSAHTFLELATGRVNLHRGLLTERLDPKSHQRLGEYLPLLR
jgi:uncharacterized protein (TIGR03083 family)